MWTSDPCVQVSPFHVSDPHALINGLYINHLNHPWLKAIVPEISMIEGSKMLGVLCFKELDCRQYGANDLAKLGAQHILHLQCVDF